MAFVIPTQATALYSQQTSLEGRAYSLTFAWNGRDGHWYLDISDEAGVPISVGLRVTVSTDLLARCLDPRRPPGMLVAQDTTDTDLDPSFDELGTRVQLLYFTAAEVAILKGMTSAPV